MRITLLDGKNSFTEGCVGGEASILQQITNVFVIHRVVKWKLLKFIRPGGKKRCIHIV